MKRPLRYFGYNVTRSGTCVNTGNLCQDVGGDNLEMGKGIHTLHLALAISAVSIRNFVRNSCTFSRGFDRMQLQQYLLMFAGTKTMKQIDAANFRCQLSSAIHQACQKQEKLAS